MLALWSRATQATSTCRCSFCLHAVAGVARQTTRATSKRGFRAGDLFTACYSTILGTAIFVDARVKESRRKEWDRVIAEVEAGIAADTVTIPERSPERQNNETPNVNIRYLLANDNLGSFDNTTWSAPKVIRTMISPRSNVRRLEKQIVALRGHAPNPLPKARYQSSASCKQEGLMAQSSTELLSAENYTPREPRSPLHLEKMEGMTRSLVGDLLMRINMPSKKNAAEDNLCAPTCTALDTQLAEMGQQIQSLRSGSLRLPTYSWTETSAVQRERTALNQSLLALCSRSTTEQPSINLLVLKICYNLLICTSPPNITTYNLLIREFSRLQQQDFAQSVIENLFDQSKLKPNDITIKLIIAHNRSKKDSGGFQDTINRMRAADRPILIRSRSIYDLVYPAVQEWSMTSKVCHRGAHLFQKVDRTSSIFESLIKTAFELKGLGSTVRLIRAALREGRRVAPSVIYRVVEALDTRKDYRAARSLLEAFLKACEASSESIINISSDLRSAIYKLFALCNIDPIESYRNPPPFLPRHRSGLKKLALSMKLASLEDSVIRVQHIILTVERALEVISRASQNPSIDESLSVQSIEEITSFVRRASFREWRREKYRLARLRDARMIQLGVLQRKLTEVVKSISVVAREVVEIHQRRLRYDDMRMIEAALRAQAKWILIQEYALVPLLFDQGSDTSWDEFTSSVNRFHRKGFMFTNVLEYAARVIERQESHKMRHERWYLSQRTHLVPPQKGLVRENEQVESEKILSAVRSFSLPEVSYEGLDFVPSS